MILKISRLFLVLFCFSIIAIQFSSCKSEPKNQNTNVGTGDLSQVSVRLKNEPDFLTPILTTSAYARKVFKNTHASLMEHDPISKDWIPKLLVSAPVISPIEIGVHKGGFRYDYALKVGAKWDDGSPILASDVLFSIKAILNPKVNTRHRSGTAFIKDFVINPKDPRKFSIFTDECDMHAVLSVVSTHVLPKYYYDPKGILDEFSFLTLKSDKSIQKIKGADQKLQAFADAFSSPEMTHQSPLGAGAYRVKEWISGQKIVLEKKEKWWGNTFKKEGKIFENYPKTIVYKIIPDEMAAITMAKSGELDVITELSFENFNDLKTNEVAQNILGFHSPPTNIYYYLALNNQNDKLKDKRVRKALSHLIDLEKLMATSMHGFAQRIHGPIMPHSKYFNKDLKFIEHDLNAASSLLDDAGWIDTDKDGLRDKMINGVKVDLKFDVSMASSSVTGKQILQFMQMSGKKVGVGFNEKFRTTRQILREDAPKGDFEIASLGSRTHMPYNPKGAYHTDNFPPNGQNNARFGTVESDKIIDSIVSNCDDEVKRKSDYMKFQAIIYDEQPMIFLFNAKDRIAFNNRFVDGKSYGVFPGFMDNWMR